MAKEVVSTMRWDHKEGQAPKTWHEIKVHEVWNITTKLKMFKRRKHARKYAKR